MILHRGDRSQFARDSRLAGITTRLMMGGNPATVNAVGLWEAARAHVKWENASERRFLETTPFLSFTESREKAAYYALGRSGEGCLVLHDKAYGEDTNLIELDASGMVNDGEAGLFVLDYPCDMSLGVPLGEGIEYEGQEKYVRCEYCAPDNKLLEVRVDDKGQLLHRIQLINVRVFLAAHPDHERYAGARDQSERDREWLVYPMDYVERLKGNSGLVQLAPIWRRIGYKIVDPDAPAASPESRIILPYDPR